MNDQEFDALIATEEARLGELEAAVVGASAALEGAESAIVAAKLDGASAADLNRLEADVDGRVASLDSAQRSVERQRSQIAAIRQEHEHRTRLANVEAATAELEQARGAWPATLAAWDQAIEKLEPIWAEMKRIRDVESSALRRLEKLGEPQQSYRIPPAAQGSFPVPPALHANLHWTIEDARREYAERQAQYQRGRDFVDHLNNLGAPSAEPAAIGAESQDAG